MILKFQKLLSPNCSKKRERNQINFAFKYFLLCEINVGRYSSYGKRKHSDSFVIPKGSMVVVSWSTSSTNWCWTMNEWSWMKPSFPPLQYLVKILDNQKKVRGRWSNVTRQSLLYLTAAMPMLWVNLKDTYFVVDVDQTSNIIETH